MLRREERERRDQTDGWMKGFKERHLTRRSVKSKSKTPKQSSDVRKTDGPQPNGSPLI